MTVAVEAGVITVAGSPTINPKHEVKAKGHPQGAGGVAKCVELYQQRRGEAVNQADGARIGLAHNLATRQPHQPSRFWKDPAANGN